MRLLFPLALLTGCGAGSKSAPEAFRLAFTATDGGSPVDCTTPAGGLGDSGAYSLGISDLRFYVSNLEFRDDAGEVLTTTFDANDFQYQGGTGWVGLIDLTGNTDGTCTGSAVAYSEGTARTNDAISGETLVGDVASITFDVGVPQALMQEVIGSTTAEAAPSPLNEMFWSWATGYRHFVMNATVSDGSEEGDSYMHVGSTGCAADGELALENQDSCEFVNTPHVEIDAFDLAADSVALDLAALVAGLDFLSPIYDPDTFEVIGEGVGVECHSSPDQPDCPVLFDNFGVEIATGEASAANNLVFVSL